MKLLVEKWRKFIGEEEEEESLFQNEWEAEMKMTISKTVGGDKTETLRFVRAIPDVTQVSKEVEYSDTDTAYTGLFKIKFVLAPDGNPLKYIKRTLLPGIDPGINGISLDFESVTYNEVE